MHRVVGQTVGGFLLVLCGVGYAASCEVGMAMAASAAGTLFFATGKVQQLTGHPVRLAAWLRANF